MRKMILASHGGLAHGLVDTTKMIIGDMAGDIRSYSLLPGGVAASFADELEREIQACPDTEFLILTDLYGASVCTAMSDLSRYNNVRVFSGMNLNLVLSLCTDHTEPLDENEVREVLEGARDGISAVDVTTLVGSQDDF